MEISGVEETLDVEETTEVGEEMVEVEDVEFEEILDSAKLMEGVIFRKTRRRSPNEQT